MSSSSKSPRNPAGPTQVIDISSPNSSINNTQSTETTKIQENQESLQVPNSTSSQIWNQSIDPKQPDLSNKAVRLTLVSESLNTNLQYLEKTRQQHQRKVLATETADSSSLFRPIASSASSSVSHEKQEKHGGRVPSYILHGNKEAALSLKIKPSDSNFVFWFLLSSYCPLVASCLGPLANMISIAALVDSWRVDSSNNYVPDPAWVIAINSLSIAFGTVSDASLIMNFSRNLPYLVAQTISIAGWFVASILLVAIIIAESVHVSHGDAVLSPSEGYFFAILTAILYFLNASLLFCNLVGYLKGKYNDEFNLDSSQRAMIFYVLSLVVWLSIGSAAFTKLIDINYGTALYFSIVSVTTVGLGDIVPKSDGGKAFVLVYALIGLLILGLIIATVRGMVFGKNEPIVFWSQVERRREKLYKKYMAVLERGGGESAVEGAESAMESAVEEEAEVESAVEEAEEEESLEEAQDAQEAQEAQTDKIQEPHQMTSTKEQKNEPAAVPSIKIPLRSSTAQRIKQKRADRKRLRHLGKHPDRVVSSEDMFKMMELIRRSSHNYQRFLSLASIVFVFVCFWLLGALAFKLSEGWRYFDSIYFCFLCLLTIGYGVPSPEAPFSRAFFVCWALGAVPLNTILISNIGDTIFILCVDYSDKIMRYVLFGRYMKVFKFFHKKRETIDQLEHDIEKDVEAWAPEESEEAKPQPHDKKSEFFSQLSSANKEFQTMISQEIKLTQENGGSAGHSQPAHGWRIIQRILKTQRDILEFIDILESIELLMNDRDSKGHKLTHSYDDWMHLSKLIESTDSGENFTDDAMYWISDKSPLKYPLDEKNYFFYRYLRILDRKIFQLLKDNIGHYNEYLEVLGGGEGGSEEAET